MLQKCVTALDKAWHPEHFCCMMCGRLLGDENGFHEHDGRPYCKYASLVFGAMCVVVHKCQIYGELWLRVMEWAAYTMYTAHGWRRGVLVSGVRR